MAKLSSGPDTIWQADNHELAHIQVAVHRLFSAGRGFFVTTYVSRIEMRSNWISASADLTFAYDLEDDDGERIAPVTIDSDTVDFWETQLRQPLGLAYGNTLDMPLVPFFLRAEK